MKKRIVKVLITMVTTALLMGSVFADSAHVKVKDGSSTKGKDVPHGIISEQTPSGLDEFVHENAFKLLGPVMDEPKEYGINGVFNNISISQPYVVYNLVGDGIESSELYNYLIYSNNKAVGIITASTNEDGSFSMSFGEEYASNIVKSASESNMDYIVLNNGDTIQLINEQGHQKKLIEIPEFIKDGQLAKMSQSANIVNFIKQNQSNTKVNLKTNENTITLDDSGTLNIKAPSSSYLSVNKVRQSLSDTCWAACMSSALKYKINLSKTDSQIASETGHGNNPAKMNYISSYMDYYGCPTDSYGSPLYGSSIVDEIIDGDPIFLGLSTKDGYGHCVLARGYRGSSSSIAISIMEPYAGSYKTMYSDSESGTWAIYAGGKKWYYIQTAVID